MLVFLLETSVAAYIVSPVRRSAYHVFYLMAPLAPLATSTLVPGYQVHTHADVCMVKLVVVVLLMLLPLVKIDSSFYGIPTIFMVKHWHKRSTHNFRFTAKFPKIITHDKRLKDVDKELEQFFEAFSPRGLLG